jgi:hypothetical protein
LLQRELCLVLVRIGFLKDTYMCGGERMICGVQLYMNKNEIYTGLAITMCCVA